MPRELTFSHELFGRITWELSADLEDYLNELAEAGNSLEQVVLRFLEQILSRFAMEVACALVTARQPTNAMNLILAKVLEMSNSIDWLQLGDRGKVH